MKNGISKQLKMNKNQSIDNENITNYFYNHTRCCLVNAPLGKERVKKECFRKGSFLTLNRYVNDQN